MPKKRGVRLYIGRSGEGQEGASERDSIKSINQEVIFDQEYISRGPIRSQ